MRLFNVSHKTLKIHAENEQQKTMGETEINFHVNFNQTSKKFM